nr:MAG TPA: Major capsid protein [Microviridae sp.]
MANIMSLKSLRNKTSRNGFDLSSKRNFTAKCGELLPVKTWEVLPGDSWSIDLRAFTRTQPLNTAAFARMREYYDFYFVPYDLLWNKANTVLTQMYDNPQHATSLIPSGDSLAGEMPYITCEQIATYLSTFASVSSEPYAKNFFGYNRAKLSAKLLEYLGYGNFSVYATGTEWDSDPLAANLQLNVFGLLAYQKIYSDFFRESQWEKCSPSTFNVDYMTGIGSMNVTGTSDSAFLEEYNFFDLRYCNWQKDLFHGALPRQQYGDVATVAVSGTASGSPLAVDADFSILALRQAEFLQKWKEITQSGNQDYKEQIEKHWNVSPSDGFSEMCTYLGGISSSLDINEVVNNNITGDNAADIAGKGTGVSNGRISFNSQGRYGLIMCIYHCLPLIDYTCDVVSPVYTKVNSTDYAIPEFDCVGMESLPLSRLVNASSSVVPYDHHLLGYVPRYIDYKTDIDTSVGAFKTTLKNWVISYNNDSIMEQLVSATGSDPEVLSNYTSFKVNPSSVNPLFAVEVDDSVDTDNFLCTSFFDVKVVRNLDTDGLPY